MKGNWATQPQGLLLASPPGGPPVGPFAATGLLTFDGKGRFSGTASSSFDGVILFPFPATGDYSVTPDCFISVFEETLGIAFEGYFTRDKSQVVFFQPQAFTVTTNTLHRLQRPPCRTEYFRNNWAIQATGKDVGASQQFAGNGRLDFDGNGRFQGATGSSLGGVIVHHNVTGTINVNADCTLTMTITDESAHTSQLFGVLYGDRSEFYFIYQDPNVVITGVGKKSVSDRDDDNQ